VNNQVAVASASRLKALADPELQNSLRTRSSTTSQNDDKGSTSPQRLGQQQRNAQRITICVPPATTPRRSVAVMASCDYTQRPSVLVVNWVAKAAAQDTRWVPSTRVQLLPCRPTFCQ